MESSFSTFKSRLCVELIQFHFGEIVGKIGECLTHFGNLTLESILHFSNLPFEAVSKSLIVLIQHNLVSYMKESVLIKHYEDNEPIPKRKVSMVLPEKRSITGNDQTVYYILLYDQVINLLHVGNEVHKVEKRLGELSSDIFQLILSHGRLSFNMIKDMMIKKKKTNKEIQIGFEKLAMHSFVQIVQKEISMNIRTTSTGEKRDDLEIEEEEGRKVPTLSLPKLRKKKKKKKKEKKKKKKKKKRKRKRKKKSRKRSRRKKASVDEHGDLASDSDLSSDSSSSSMDEEEYDEESDDEESNRPRKRVKLSNLNEPNSMNDFDFDGDLWKVNHTTFLMENRIQNMVDYVKDILDPSCSRVIEEIVFQTLPYPNLSEQFSKNISFSNLKERLVEKYGVKISDIRDAISKLVKKQILRESEGSSDEYYVWFHKIIEECKILHVSRILERKFGVTAARIFMVLIKGQKFEQEGICSKIMVNEREVRTILVKLVQYGYLEIHDLPKSADRAPQKTIHLYSVNLQSLYRIMVNEMYKTCRNLRRRGYKEEEENLMPMVRHEVLQGLVQPNEEERQIIEKSYQSQDRIEGSMMRLLNFINLFESF